MTSNDYLPNKELCFPSKLGKRERYQKPIVRSNTFTTEQNLEHFSTKNFTLNNIYISYTWTGKRTKKSFSRNKNSQERWKTKIFQEDKKILEDWKEDLERCVDMSFEESSVHVINIPITFFSFRTLTYRVYKGLSF